MRCLQVKQALGFPMRPGRKRRAPRVTLPGKVTLADIERAEKAQRMAETATVLSQPHRRGFAGTEAESALGRFCLTLGTIGKDYQRAGEQYGALVRRWRSAWGAKTSNPAPDVPGSGEGPSDARVRAWREEIDGIEAMLSRISITVRFAVNRVCVDEFDVLPQSKLDARHGLHALAIHLGIISSRTHPFR